MKKKVLFVLTYFDCGGTCRSLQNLLNIIDENLIEVDVFGMVEEGMFCNMFSNCTIIPEKTWLRALISRYSQQKGLQKWESLLAKLLRILTHGKFSDWIFQKKASELLKAKSYDAVIAFSEGVPTHFVSLMKHPNKIAWIHCDYANYYELNSKCNEFAIYNNFKSIVCVSKYTRRSFINIYPSFASKTKVIYNPLDVNVIKQMSQKPISVDFQDDIFKIISIGRLDPVKNLSVIPSIAYSLKKIGCNFCWYIVGPKGGTDDEYNKLIANIDSFKVGDCVKWLGEQRNPYNLISHSNLLVCTSYSEACPYVINEAKVLGIPIVSTDFGSADEFIDFGNNGYNISITLFPKTISSLILNKTNYNSLIKALSSFQYNNMEIIRSVYDMI